MGALAAAKSPRDGVATEAEPLDRPLTRRRLGRTPAPVDDTRDRLQAHTGRDRDITTVGRARTFAPWRGDSVLMVAPRAL
jgi:hypothetical protein